MSETKVITHGTTAANDYIASSNPPPYPGPQSGELPQPGYPAPTPGVTYVHPQPATTTVITGGAIVIAQPIGPKPTTYVCKSCHQQIETRVESKPTTRTHLFALLLCAIGCWCCVCIPYCRDDCLSADHYCPNCNAYIGSYKN